MRNKKKKLLKKKYNTYHRNVSKYNENRRRNSRIPDPSFEEVEEMPVTDEFWDLGALTHPAEDWATNKHTKAGIQAFLLKRAAVEELRRISRETRQLIEWALAYQLKIDNVVVEMAQNQGKSTCVVPFSHIDLLNFITYRYFALHRRETKKAYDAFTRVTDEVG